MILAAAFWWVGLIVVVACWFASRERRGRA